MRVLKMDNLHTELSNCQFFQSSLLNLMRTLQQEASLEEAERVEVELPVESAPPPVV